MTTAEQDPITLAAADWFARLQEPDVSLEETLAWQRWMNEDPRHAQAFSDIEEVAATLHTMNRPALAHARAEMQDEYDGSVPIADWRPPERSAARTFAIAASVLLVSATLGWLAFRKESPLLTPRMTAFETGIGENREVSLTDGSRVMLGGNTRLEIALGKTERRLVLSRGEAFFNVAKDKTRPFTVDAGEAKIVAVGTEFNVRRGGDRVVVAVVEGQVLVEPASPLLPTRLLRKLNRRLAAVPVSAGEQIAADRSGTDLEVRTADSSSATAWQTGRLAFRREPLRYALEDVNRYAAKPIVIVDKSIGEMQITGTVVDGNVTGWIASLESTFGLTGVEEKERIVLRRK